MNRRRAGLALLLGIGIVVFVLLYEAALRLKPETSPVARGGAVLGVQKCLACHAGDGITEISPQCTGKAAFLEQHPVFEESRCEDLLAFFAAARVRDSFEERLASNTPNSLLAGEQLARRFYCFQCHGELGQGGFPNVGALKGYIPGYFGNDFRLLTNNASPQAVRRWLRRGTNPNLFEGWLEGPVARYYFERQSVQMPAFDSLTDAQADLLVDYVITLQTLGPMNAASVDEYERLTRSAGPSDK